MPFLFLTSELARRLPTERFQSFSREQPLRLQLSWFYVRVKKRERESKKELRNMFMSLCVCSCVCAFACACACMRVWWVYASLLRVVDNSWQWNPELLSQLADKHLECRHLKTWELLQVIDKKPVHIHTRTRIHRTYELFDTQMEAEGCECGGIT